MNRLLLLLVFIGIEFTASSQPGYLFVKRGYKKVRTYMEGDRIMIKTNSGAIYYGLITLLLNDTIYINGKPVPRTDVTSVVLNPTKRELHVDAKTLLLITAGVALTTAGISLSKQASFQRAATAGAVIGYGPLALGYIRSKISFRRKRYRIGKKFRLQILEFHIPRQAQRPF